MVKKVLLVLALSMLVATVAVAGGSQESTESYPSKDITVICPFGAGGGTDALARKMAEIASKNTGINIIVENKTGGSGAVGMTEGSMAKADGYTVTMTTVEAVLLPLSKLASFQAADFQSIIRVNFDAAALVVRSDNPANTLQEFVDNASSSSKAVSIMTSAFPTNYWLCGAMLKDTSGVDFNIIEEPQGGAAQIQNLLGKHVDSTVITLGEVSQYLASGEFKALAVASSERNAAFPEVPTFVESGFDVEVGTWRGFSVPKDTDPAIVAKLEEIFTEAYNTAEFQEFLTNMKFGAGYLNSSDFQALVESQTEQYGPVVGQYVK